MKYGSNLEGRICVCGAGHQGIAMAAHLALNGECVSLWNRTAEHIRKIEQSRMIHCEGVVNGDAMLEKVSSDIREVISDFIMITAPSNAHADIAKVIAPYVNKDTIIILNPGRTFGAIDFADHLRKNGVKKLPHIAETQTIVYTCRKRNEDHANIIAMKRNVSIASLDKNDIEYIMERLPECLKGYFQVATMADTSFSNMGMILHCAPVLMNIGWIESEKTIFKYYYDGISRTIAHFLEKLDKERIFVAEKMGYKMETVEGWLKRTYGVKGQGLFECLQNNDAYKEIDAPPRLENSRYILEDVPEGLVPIEYMAKQLEIETPYITLIIDLANAIYEIDFRKRGRKISLENWKEYNL